MANIGVIRAPAMLVSILVVAGAVGCGPGQNAAPGGDPGQEALEESQKLYEQAAQEHLIGHDQRGLPVYGVDEDGHPVTRRDK